MTSGSDIPGPLAEAIEKIKRDAYAKGWRDALAAVNKSAADLAEQAGNIDLSKDQVVSMND